MMTKNPGLADQYNVVSDTPTGIVFRQAKKLSTRGDA